MVLGFVDFRVTFEAECTQIIAQTRKAPLHPCRYR
jgi:hypothetical protein